MPNESLIAFYTSDYVEAARLTRANNRLELLRTQRILRARLPPAPARILDVGGATGVHAAWLATDGYEVEIIDLVPDHVRQARELSARLGVAFDARVGDARALDAPDASVDACLLLGPLYHLADRADRIAALTEAVRVTRPGGLIAAAAICRYAWPLYDLRDGRDLRGERGEAIAATVATGRTAPKDGVTTAQEGHMYSHRPQELAEELAVAGARDVEVLGLEGPGWILFTPGLSEERTAALLEAAVNAATMLDGNPEVVAASAHLLAIGRAGND